jgi:hypothetical protein
VSLCETRLLKARKRKKEKRKKERKKERIANFENSPILLDAREISRVYYTVHFIRMHI